MGLAIASRTFETQRVMDESRWTACCVRRQISIAFAGRMPAPEPKTAIQLSGKSGQLKVREERVTDAFVERYMPLVERVVAPIARKVQGLFEHEDLLQAGRLGLVIAARTAPKTVAGEEFDPQGWAAFCIRREALNLVCAPSYGDPREDGKRNQETGAFIESRLNVERPEDTEKTLRDRGEAMHAVSPAEEPRHLSYRMASGVRRPLPPPESEADPRLAIVADAIQKLSPRQQNLVAAVYEMSGSRSPKQILRELGGHRKGFKKAMGVGWRKLEREHGEVIEILRGALEEAGYSKAA